MSKIIKNLLLVALGAVLALTLSGELRKNAAERNDFDRVFYELKELNPNNDKDILVIPKENVDEMGDNYLISILEIKNNLKNEYEGDMYLK